MAPPDAVPNGHSQTLNQRVVGSSPYCAHKTFQRLRSVDTITGPGRLTRALGITGALNNRVGTAQNGIWFVKDARRESIQVMRTKRIGVDYAGPIWSIKPYRFVSIAAPKGPLHDH